MWRPIVGVMKLWYPDGGSGLHISVPLSKPIKLYATKNEFYFMGIKKENCKEFKKSLRQMLKSFLWLENQLKLLTKIAYYGHGEKMRKYWKIRKKDDKNKSFTSYNKMSFWTLPLRPPSLLFYEYLCVY